MKVRHVYFIQNPATGNIKIGASADPIKRKKQLESEVGNQLCFLYVHAWGGVQKEKEFHERFKKYLIRGEWFRFGWGLRRFINRLKKEKLIWITKRISMPKITKKYKIKGSIDEIKNRQTKIARRSKEKTYHIKGASQTIRSPGENRRYEIKSD